MSEIKNSKWAIRLPLIVAITLIGGIFIGAKMFGNETKGNDPLRSANKFRDIIHYISSEYVDTVNTEELTDEAITKMLEKLDPHSVYIPPKDIDMAKAQLESDFEGIGIEFQIMKDTLLVSGVIPTGPSEQVGLNAGDKIMKVDDKNIFNIKLTNQDVFKYLRGKKGTKVKVSIKRRGVAKLMDFTITRDKIPTFSVDAAIMIDEQTGYIKVNRFAQKTYEEFKKGLTELKAKGVKRMVLDLRGNPGGYMDHATKMADEFLSGDKMIVFTKGKQSRYNQEHRCYIPGDFEKGAVIVLVDEGSASASEIVSGALQDNDRGLVVGRRSFGKGLVQMPIPLGDNSELRLTISRYYTPSGRSIQKPYSKGDGDSYEMDLSNRYKKGEFFNQDSIKFDKKLQFKTSKGRTVYGGGGIMPDYFVPRDTSMLTAYLGELYNKGIIREYTLEYIFANKKELEKMPFETFKKTFDITDAMLKDLIAMGEKEGAKFVEKDYNRSKEYIKNQVKSLIARGVWKNEGFYSIYLEKDEVFLQAMKLFDKAEKIEKGKF
ncbi:MAG: S41 family peptidase [Bacteroidetes bacterium]|nr:MAG: S41 family peptidase [Bacteroidota bacterium]